MGLGTAETLGRCGLGKRFRSYERWFGAVVWIQSNLVRVRVKERGKGREFEYQGFFTLRFLGLVWFGLVWFARYYQVTAGNMII